MMLTGKINYINHITELLVITSNNHSTHTSDIIIKLGDSMIKPNTTVKNLGVIFDSVLNLNQQVNSICKAAYFTIHQIGKIRKFLNISATKSLVNALVTSKLDYCNSLLSRSTVYNLHKLQRVQNSCARLIMRKRKFDHITPILRELHWLPVEKRIEFKILLLAYKCLNGLAPTYLSELLDSYQPVKTLRSKQQNLLKITSTRLKTFGDRAFSVTAPTLWNQLPPEIKSSSTSASFKMRLNTHLFC